MNPVARLVFPALRWRASSGFAHEREKIDATVALGVGGYILFGGEADAARALTQEIQAASAHPLLIASDFERGGGQQFEGLTDLPPPAALGFLDDLDLTSRCGAVTAADARRVGINWVYAPVADLDGEPDNPIVQTRSFGDVPDRVGRHVAAWIRAAQEGGVAACAKHYPGHGRTTADSHETLPRVLAAKEDLARTDLVPFAAAVASGVRSVMTAHVAYGAWDSGVPATLSARIIRYLRSEMGFDGLVVTDALIMEGALRGGGEADAASDALRAGCDALLYPRDHAAVIARLDEDARDRARRMRIDDALGRVALAADELAQAPSVPAASASAPDAHRAFADAVADIAVHVLRGTTLDLDPPLEIAVVDDDIGGPYAVGPRDLLEQALRRADVGLGPAGSRVVLVYAEPRSWKGRAGLGDRSTAQLRRLVPGARLVVLFGHPRLLTQIPGNVPVLCAWHGQPLMQHAAARWVQARMRSG